MNALDTQVEALKAIIEKAGGKANIDQQAPDFAKKAFIEMVISCPDCRAAIGTDAHN